MIRRTQRGALHAATLVLCSGAVLLAMTGLTFRRAQLARVELERDIVDAQLAEHDAVQITLQILDYFAHVFPQLVLAGGGQLLSNYPVGDSVINAYIIPIDPTGSASTPDEYQWRLYIEAMTGEARRLASVEIDYVPSQYRERVLATKANELVRYWPMDESGDSFSTMHDIGPYAADGWYSGFDVAGATTGPDGGPAPWFSFTNFGYEDGVQVGIDKGTFMFWVRADPGFGTRPILVATQQDGTEIYNLYVDLINTSQIRVEFEENWFDVAASGSYGPHDFTEWTHVTLTWKGGRSSCAKLYINAVEVFELDLGKFEIGDLLELTAGFDHSTSLDGSIRELAVWESEIQANEIEDAYGDGFSPPTLSVLPGSYQRETSIPEIPAVLVGGEPPAPIQNGAVASRG